MNRVEYIKSLAPETVIVMALCRDAIATLKTQEVAYNDDHHNYEWRADYEVFSQGSEHRMMLRIHADLEFAAHNEDEDWLLSRVQQEVASHLRQTQC